MNFEREKYKSSTLRFQYVLVTRGIDLSNLCDIVFYISLFLVIEFTTSQNKSIPADFATESFISLAVNLLSWVIGSMLSFVSRKLKRTLKRSCEPLFISISLASFFS